MTYKFKGSNVTLVKCNYSNRRVALQFNDAEDGCPYFRATVNMENIFLHPGEVIIKDYSENEGVLEFLIENKIVSKPTRYASSGYISSPICKLLI